MISFCFHNFIYLLVLLTGHYCNKVVNINIGAVYDINIVKRVNACCDILNYLDSSDVYDGDCTLIAVYKYLF